MQTISEIADLQNKIKQAQHIILYFYDDDCPPCISLRPKIEKLVRENFPLMQLAWIDSKNSPEITAAYRVFANPAILVFFEGKEFNRYSKYISTIELEKSLNRLYKLAFNV